MTEPAAPCPADLILERHLAGDLATGSPESAHVSECPRCAARLDAMRAEGDSYMASDAADAVRSALVAKAPRARAVWWWSAMAPIAAAAVWLALFRAPPTSDFTAKGAASVELMVSHGGQIAPWTGGALAKGDPLQLYWAGARPAYVAVLGRAEPGETTRWFPVEEHAAHVEPGTHTIGDRLRFDPPFAGTVHIFLADAPFAIAPLESALREGRAPSFAGGMRTLRVPAAL